MSRSNKFFKGVSSSYVSLVANTFYTFASVPLALHYLGLEKCSLFSLAVQIAGYFANMDLGMTDSISRNLIDYKDDRDSGQYGSVIQTSVLVAAVQGFLVAVAGCLITPLLSQVLNVPAGDVPVFQTLVIVQCIVLGIGFPTRVFSVTLYAHQRSDVTNFIQAGQFLIMFGALWIGFKMHFGVYAMLMAAVIGFVWNTVLQAIVSIRLHLFPARGCWGRPQMSIFRELFSYGRDVFVMFLGWQLMNMTQVTLVSSVIGLPYVFVWTTCTKIFTLAQQLVWRIHDFSHAPFSEMFVRGEFERLCNRFKDTVILTASSAVFAGVMGATCNSDFLHLWTRGQVAWNPVNDVAMGVLLVSNSINRIHAGMVGVTKEIRFARFIYFIEGMVFVVAAYFAAKHFGFMGIILCSIVCDVLFIGSYGLYRSKELFKLSYREMTMGWLHAPLRFGAVFSIYAVIVTGLLHSFQPNIRLFIIAGLLVAAGAPLFWILGLTPPLKLEISGFGRKLATRLPVKFRPTAV